MSLTPTTRESEWLIWNKFSLRKIEPISASLKSNPLMGYNSIQAITLFVFFTNTRKFFMENETDVIQDLSCTDNPACVITLIRHNDLLLHEP